MTPSAQVRLKPVLSQADPVVVGVRRPALARAVGITALVRRAIMGGTGPAPGGVHHAPGLLDLADPEGDELEGAVVVPFPVAVDEEHHRPHVVRRAHESRGRPMDREPEHPARSSKRTPACAHDPLRPPDPSPRSPLT